MVSTSQFKAGMIIEYEGQMVEILEWQLVKMQQRQPIVRTKLRNVKTGSVLEQPFRSGEKFKDIYLEERPIQYLYREGQRYHFMDAESYHEVVVDGQILGSKANYLKENEEALGKFHGEQLLMVQISPSVVLAVSETEPGVRGDTAKSGTKPAKLETGAAVKVPLFVNVGDKVRVDTRTGQYVERVG